MTIASPFQPARGANQKITANTTAANVAIGKGSKSIRLLNTGANVIYFATYDSTSSPAYVATAGDTPLGVSGSPGAVIVIEKHPEHDRMTYIAETGATVFHAQPGEGGT